MTGRGAACASAADANALQSPIYGPGIIPIAQHDGTTVEYLYGDLLGTTLLIADNSGTVCGAYAYREHGQVKSHTGTTTTAIGYTGNWTDPDTKLVYLRARDYDPAALQFLSVDPAVRQTAQPYAYANNSPLQHADPSGLCIGMDGTPQDRVCTANDYFWSADSQSRMWGDIGAGIGNNFANMAFGIGDAATYNPGLAVFGASSWTELWRNAWIDDCAVPTNGFYYFGSIWAGAAVGAGAAGGAKAIVREVLPTPQVGSPKLQSIVDKLYKGTTNPNRKGNGTTMDAIRSESATGLPTGGKMHTIKGQESRQGLLNWLRRNPDADYHDRLVAQSLADELADVLGIPR